MVDNKVQLPNSVLGVDSDHAWGPCQRVAPTAARAPSKLTGQSVKVKAPGRPGQS